MPPRPPHHRPDPEAFEALVERALETIPQEFRDLLENVEVAVEDRPSPEVLEQMGLNGRGTLFGLYVGVPRTARSVFQWFQGPDRITIYRLPILHACQTRNEIVDQVRKTVVHEVAHHFGISDQRLRELGY